MQNNPLDPLEQTIFEQGPQATFVPVEQPASIYQEGQVIFTEPIYSVDPGIAWYELGEQAAKTANVLFGETLDYLIDSKRNAVTELQDFYQTKLNDTYIKLSAEQKAAEASGISPNRTTVDGILEEVDGIKKEWRAKADEVLETNKSVFFQPAINYWDENLNIKGLGLKYQQLAVGARGADRNISETAQKLLFDAQLSNILKKQKSERVAQAKQGYTSFDAKDVNTKVLKGAYPVAANLQQMPTDPLTEVKLFHDLDATTGQQTIREIDGKPLVIQDDSGFVRLNPELDYRSTIRAMNAEEFKYVVDMEQTGYTDSAMYSANGSFAPEIETLFKDYFDVDPLQRDPADTWKLGYLLTRMPITATKAVTKKLNLNETDAGILTIAAHDVRIGMTPDAMSKSKIPDYRSITDAMSVLSSITDPTLGGANIFAKGASAQQTVDITNNLLVPIIGSLLGLTPEEQEQYFLETAGGYNSNQFADKTPQKTIAQLLATNQVMAPVAVKTIAYFTANPQYLYDESGSIRPQEELTTAVSNFLKTETNNVGLVSVRNKTTGTITTVYNPNLQWFSPELNEDKDKALKTLLTFPASRFQPQVAGQNQSQALMSDYIKRATALVGKNLDVNMFTALYQNIKGMRKNDQQVFVSTEPPMAEIMRMAVASSPVAWTKYGYDGVSSLTDDQRTNYTIQAWEDIKPALDWDLDFDLDNTRYMAYSQAERGGIPITIRSIPTKSGKNLMDIIPNVNLYRNSFTPEIEPGVPAFEVKAAEPKDIQEFERQFKLTKQKMQAGEAPYELVHNSQAPAGNAVPFAQTLSNVREFASIPQVAQAFAYSEYDPVLPYSSSKKAYDFLVLNMDTIRDIAAQDTTLNESVGVFLKDLDKPENKRVLFTEKNVEQMFLRAKDLGIKSNADFVSFVLSVAQSTVANKETQTGWNKARASQIEYTLKSLGQPLAEPLSEKNFTVQSENPNYNGLILYSPSNKKFFSGVRFANKEGSYDLYMDVDNADSYHLVPAGTQLNGDAFKLVVSGRASTETPEDYNARFAVEFALREGTVDSAERMQQKMQELLRTSPTEEPIISRIQKPFVLPSDMIADFKTKLDVFTAKNLNDNNAWTLPLYDFTKLYFDTGSLPDRIEQLPTKYALPGHPRFIAPTRSSLSRIGDVLTADQTLGRGLEQAGENMMAPSRQYYQEELKKAKKARLDAAFKRGDFNYVYSSMFNDPVSTLRMQRPTQTGNYNQDAMNVLQLAFDPKAPVEYQYPFFEYGISSDTYQKAKTFRDAGWSAVAFEYQVQNNLIVGGRGSPRDLNVIVDSLDPTEFPLDDKLRIQLLTDVKSYMDRQGGFEPEAYRRIVSIVEDPKQGIPLKQEYLLATLSPGIRTLDGSRDMTRIRGIAERMIRGFK